MDQVTHSVSLRVAVDETLLTLNAQLFTVQLSGQPLAPANVAASVLRGIADRLDELAKAEALGLSRQIALDLVGFKPAPEGGA